MLFHVRRNAPPDYRQHTWLCLALLNEFAIDQGDTIEGASFARI